jgi:uncharacterized iron-regulated protein
LALASWSCGGSAERVDDELYDVPVAAPRDVRSDDGSVGPGAAEPNPVEVDGTANGEGPTGAGGPDVVERAALPLHGLTLDGELSEDEVWATLAQTPVVCFGETHDNAAHHFAQVSAARELAARAGGANLTLGVGFEMFQTPFQEVMDQFSSGSIDEGQLLQRSEYGRRWGYDVAFYRPLLDLVRELGLPALALNAPVELTEKIGDAGLAGLSADERASLPELDLDDPDHRAYIYELLGAAHEGQAIFDNPYTVQVVWDETMAATSSDWLLETGAGARLLVIAGLGHCHQTAIPSRVTRRTGLPALAVAPVLASRLGVPGFPTLEHYDLLVVLEDQQ